jgi:hypothetical protein
MTRPKEEHVTPLSAPHDPELALEWEIRPGIPAVPAARHLRLLQPDDVDDTTPDDAPTLAFVARMAQACAEVGFGNRPAAQLKRWVTASQLEILRRHGECVTRHPSSRLGTVDRTFRLVRGIRILAINEGVYETSAVLVGGRRSRAIAMRLEWHQGAWLITAVQL